MAETKIERKNKNSLIELMRFLFALWVLYYHSYVPYKGQLFGQGYLAVEFFFVLSGFFLMRSINKYVELPTQEGLFGILRKRFNSIAIPFIIGEVFVLIYSFRSFEISSNFLFGYLWYIRDLFIAITGIFLLRKFIKRDAVFYLILVIASAVALFGLEWVQLFAWPKGPFRSVVAIPIGIFASLIPQIKVKVKPNLILSLSGLIISAIGCFSIIVLPNKDLLLSYVLVVIGYPSLIYFANQIDFNNKFLDWLGSLSFPIYAFQCILRVIEAFGFENNTWLFVILTVLVLTYSLITCLIKNRKHDKF